MKTSVSMPPFQLKNTERPKKTENPHRGIEGIHGNIEVSLASCDAGVILTQAAESMKAG